MTFILQYLWGLIGNIKHKFPNKVIKHKVTTFINQTGIVINWNTVESE